MGKIWKYLIYILLGVFAFAWIKVVLDAGKTRDQAITETTASIKEKAGRVVGDLMDEDEEDDNDIGDGEDDLDADELDEDEILAEDWDEEDETEEDETVEEDIAEVETTAKGPAKDYEKEEAKKAIAKKPASVVTTSSNGRFLVIGGSFSSKGNANTFVKQLEKLGYEDAEIVVFDKAKKYHTVSVARFDSKNDASKLVGALKGKGIKDAYVHKKRG